MPTIEELRTRLLAAVRTLVGPTEAAALPTDPTADLPVRWGSSLAHVRIVDGDTPLLTVYSVVLEGVERSAALLGELNDMNAGIVSCRVFWADGAVIAATDVPATELQPAELEHALWSVGSFVDWADTTLQPRFGGRPGGS